MRKLKERREADMKAFEEAKAAGNTEEMVRIYEKMTGKLVGAVASGR